MNNIDAHVCEFSLCVCLCACVFFRNPSCTPVSRQQPFRLCSLLTVARSLALLFASFDSFLFFFCLCCCSSVFLRVYFSSFFSVVQRTIKERHFKYTYYVHLFVRVYKMSRGSLIFALNSIILVSLIGSLTIWID